MNNTTDKLDEIKVSFFIYITVYENKFANECLIHFTNFTKQ